MSLDEATPPTPDALMQYGRDDVVLKLTEEATREAKTGDGRALRVLERLLVNCGLRGKNAK